MIAEDLYFKILIFIFLLFRKCGSYSHTRVPADDEITDAYSHEKHESLQKIHKWPLAIVYYEISNAFNSSSRRIIRQAMFEISSKTCVKFKPRNHRTNDYIFIALKADLGCRSYVGNKRKGKQLLTLDNSRCIHQGRIIHELVHVLGFTHEHQRPDRDEYINICWDNIKNDDIPQFLKLKESFDHFMGFPYDYGSITHYANVSPTASIDVTKPIILPKHHRATLMGQRDGLSPLDIEKINMLYRCSSRRGS